MYLAVIYSLIITALVVMAVKRFQPTDSYDELNPASKKASKTLFATGFFLFIVLLIAFHLMGIGETHSQTGGTATSAKYDYESGMIEKMNQTVHTGFPPF